MERLRSLRRRRTRTPRSLTGQLPFLPPQILAPAAPALNCRGGIPYTTLTTDLHIQPMALSNSLLLDIRHGQKRSLQSTSRFRHDWGKYTLRLLFEHFRLLSLPKELVVVYVADIVKPGIDKFPCFVYCLSSS